MNNVVEGICGAVLFTVSQIPSLSGVCEENFDLASEICWQCRTYFRRYGTGAMKQIVGYTDQRHDYQSVFHPESGRDQWRF